MTTPSPDDRIGKMLDALEEIDQRLGIPLVRTPRTPTPPAPPSYGGNHGSPHNDSMTMTREELDARLSALAERSDARARETELMAEARLARFEERIDQSIGEMRRDRAAFSADLKEFKNEVKAENKSTRTTMVVTAIASAIAIVGGIASFNATVLGNMQSSFQTGNETGASLATTAEQLKAVAADLKVMQDRLDKQVAAPALPTSQPK